MAAPTVPTTTTRIGAQRQLGALPRGRGRLVLLGVYANEHTATKEKPYTLVFSDTIQLKVWFATAAFVLAVVQIFLALRLYDKIHWPNARPHGSATPTDSPVSPRSR